MTRRTSTQRGRRAVLAVCAAASLLISGCGFTGIYDIPLPGGADVGDDPIEMKVHFTNVLDLVPQTHVKINEVVVGRVQRIDLADDGWHAEVSLLVNRDVDMPANTLANIKMSSLLGEKYVELERPPEGTEQGVLDSGAVIPLSRTNRNTEIEEVLGALSMLLNGGGVEQLNTITKELNNVYTGSGGERELRAVLRNADEFVRSLDGQTDAIERALDGLNRLSATLDAEKEVIEGALDDLAPGMEVLIDQREELVGMLQALERLSDVAVDTMDRSTEDFVDNLQELRPILKNLADAGADLPNSLSILVSFPFADSAVEGVKGDYFNLFPDFELDLQLIMEYFQSERGNPMPNAPIVRDLPLEEGGLLDPSQLPNLGDLPLSRSQTGSGALTDPAADVLGGLLGGGNR